MLKYSSGEVGQADINFSKNSAFFQSKKEHKYENTQTIEGDKHAYSGASALKKQPKSALLAAKQAASTHKASDKPAFFARKSTKANTEAEQIKQRLYSAMGLGKKAGQGTDRLEADDDYTKRPQPLHKNLGSFIEENDTEEITEKIEQFENNAHNSFSAKPDKYNLGAESYTSSEYNGDYDTALIKSAKSIRPLPAKMKKTSAYEGKNTSIGVYGVLTFSYILGLATGSVLLFQPQTQAFVQAFGANYFAQLNSPSIFALFFQSFTPSFMLNTLILFVCYCSIAAPAAIIVPFIKGISVSFILSYIFIEVNLKTLLFAGAALIPQCVISAICTIIFCKLAYSAASVQFTSLIKRNGEVKLLSNRTIIACYVNMQVFCAIASLLQAFGAKLFANLI